MSDNYHEYMRKMAQVRATREANGPRPKEDGVKPARGPR